LRSYAHSFAKKSLEFVMKGARYAVIILIVVWVFVSMAACIITGGGGGSGTPAPAVVSGDDVTATYGADLFHEQLTAIARDRLATPEAHAP
jgi:hypothetical protein